MNTQDVKSVINSYYAALSAKDWDGWVSMFADDATRHDYDGQKHVGKESLKKFITAMGGLFESINIVADSTYVTKEGTAVRWVAMGTGNNGERVEFSGIDIFKLDDNGKIAEEWVYWSPTPVIEKLSS